MRARNMFETLFKRRPKPTGLAGPRAQKLVSLALQGGGAHGAFTWGVLDALLEDGRLAIEAISGASAGAMNAVVLADGYLAGGADEARAHLARFWKKMSHDGSLNPMQRAVMDQLLGFWPRTAMPWTQFLPRMSPYEVNPLNINVLKTVIEDLIDFERIRASRTVKLFIAATNVRTGKIAVFENEVLTADHLMASACLPTIFQTVEIDGVPYWDGGYSGNPPLFPLFHETASDDIVLVQINPTERAETPHSANEIRDRLAEINFNAPLLRELRMVEFIGRLIDEGKLSRTEYKRVLMHRIDADEALNDMPGETRANTDWSFFRELRDHGRAAAFDWLSANFNDVGQRASLDMEAVVG